MSSRVVRLGQVVNINPTTRPSGSPDDTVSFIAMADVSEDGRVTSVQQRPLSEVQKGYTAFQAGDVLLAKITPCFENGKAALVASLPTKLGFGSTEFHVLRPTEEIDQNFLFHLVWNPNFRRLGASRMTGSAGQKRVPVAFLADYEFTLPPLPKQQRIATILDKADSLRRKRQEAIRLADEFLRAVFIDMFGDLTVNPHCWPEVLLGELIVDGPRNGLYCPSDLYGSGTSILRIDGFYDGEIVNDYQFKRVLIDESTATRFRLMNDSVVLNRVNSREFVGKSAHVLDLDELTVFESNMMNFSVDKNRIDTFFLVRQLQSKFIRGQIARARKDAVNQSSINQEDVKNLRILVPPITVQQRFRNISDRLVPLRHRLELSKSLSVKAQASLSHSLFLSVN